LLGAMPNQRDVAARTERKRKRIKQDRLAGAGLAGQRSKAFGEVDIKPLDQNDVADGQPGQHGQMTESGRQRTYGPRLSVILPLSSALRHPLRPVSPAKARLIQEPLFSDGATPRAFNNA
jgi:hypothetical protein